MTLSALELVARVVEPDLLQGGFDGCNQLLVASVKVTERRTPPQSHLDIQCWVLLDLGEKQGLQESLLRCERNVNGSHA